MMVNLVSMLFWSFTCMFIICEFGENVSTSFDEINDSIDALDWYLYPNGTQRYLPTLILQSQQPVLITGYANILFNRDAFKRVSEYLFVPVFVFLFHSKKKLNFNCLNYFAEESRIS